MSDSLLSEQTYERLKEKRQEESCVASTLVRLPDCHMRMAHLRHIVIAAFDGCQGPDLAPALLFALFHPPASSPGCSPSTASMPYLPSYGFNALTPSLDLSSSSSLLCSSSSPSPLLNACSPSMLVEGTQCQILHLVHGQICVQNYRA
ncbi:hypothetical protein EDD85DRAFT_945076 [Armillaria nabsnona]|nr:hypothetical protein EDD85DRAFT_945076 [Armillaria nabsnona]